MAVETHKKKHRLARCMIVTISDTRTAATDKSGRVMIDLLEQAGHKVEVRKIIPDKAQTIQTVIDSGCANTGVDVILTNGGTGIASRDVTIETVKPLFDKEITGFGELFRMLSYTEDIGSAALMSRAIAGIRHHTAIFSLPGSSGAVKLAMNKLIIPELSHIVHEIKKDL